jgi:tetratricopeptide (TPR) repeat protein
MLAKQQKYEEAEATYQRVLEAGERVLGRDHENMQYTCYKLSYVLRQQKRYEEAEAIYSSEECMAFESWTAEEDDCFNSDEVEEQEAALSESIGVCIIFSPTRS